MITMNFARIQLQPASSGRTALGADRTPSTRAAAVVLAQLAAAAGYGALFVVGDAPDPFSSRDWAFMLLPPAGFAFLLVAGLFGVTSSGIAVRRRALSGLGSFVAACGLAVGLVFFYSTCSDRSWTTQSANQPDGLPKGCTSALPWPMLFCPGVIPLEGRLLRASR
jgi:hypothetical protein